MEAPRINASMSAEAQREVVRELSTGDLFAVLNENWTIRDARDYALGLIEAQGLDCPEWFPEMLAGASGDSNRLANMCINELARRGVATTTRRGVVLPASIF